MTVEGPARPPSILMRSLTWDRGGHEMAGASARSPSRGGPADLLLRPGITPWQRSSNENTNGLLRDYFPKGSDLSPQAQRRANLEFRRR